MNHWAYQIRWRAWLLWSGVALLVVGFVVERSWRSLPAPRALETLLLGALALACAGLLRRLLRLSLASALAVVFFIAMTCFVGVLPTLATLLLGGAGLSLGCWMAGSARHGSIATIAGIAILAGASGWLLPFPVHFRFVYFLLLSIVFVAGRLPCLAALSDGVVAWRRAVNDSPRIAVFAVLVVGLASAGCWLPTVQFDDLAYHLGLPSQLAMLGYYKMDVHSQIWALAPWCGDIIQAIAQLLAGEEARGAVDALWLFTAAMLSWQLAAALDAPAFARWLTVALFASLPLTAGLVGGMQAELPATAASLALALTVATAPKQASLRQLLLFAIVAGFLLGLKTGFIAIIAPIGVWLIVRWRGQWSWRLAGSGLACTVVTCGSSYAYAGLLTGNPVFPLLNGVLQSALLEPANLSDPRWTTSVGLDIPWQLTFHTRAYFEGWDGAAGFCALGLIGAAVVALTSPRLRPLAASAIVAFIAAIGTVHYFRYAYPAMVLLTPAMVAAVALATSQRKATILLCALVVVDLGYQSCSQWTLHVGGIKRRMNPWEGVSVTERLAPERSLIQLGRAKNPAASVLLCSPDAPFAAELGGRGFTTAYYDPELERARLAADADASGDGWRALFARTRANFAITSSTRTGALTAALGDAQLLRETGGTQLWQLPAPRADAPDLARERDLASARFRP